MPQKYWAAKKRPAPSGSGANPESDLPTPGGQRGHPVARVLASTPDWGGEVKVSMARGKYQHRGSAAIRQMPGRIAIRARCDGPTPEGVGQVVTIDTRREMPIVEPAGQ